MLCVRKKVSVSVSPETATFDLNTLGENYVDVVLTLSGGTSIDVLDVYIDTTKLTKTTHYTVVGNVVTIKKTRVDDLAVGTYAIKLLTSHQDVEVALTVEDTTS